MQTSIINFYDKKFITPQNRFNIKKEELTELKKKFDNSKILITGAAGSIGSFFCKNIFKFNFYELILLDKDENGLTELNRLLATYYDKNKLKKIHYICTDLNSININNFITTNHITHYLNFAAVKHVRSEDNLISSKYMLETNSKNFLYKKKIKSKKLSQVFSISTDKAVNPSSVLGATKKLMEYRLKEFKKLNKNVQISSVRFANVSFSNGSILKNVIDKIENKQPLGIPRNIKRFFITHQEAVNLCLKSLLGKCDNKILVPKIEKLNKQIYIEDLVRKILTINKLKITQLKKKHLKKNLFFVKFSKNLFTGQKNEEEMITFEENKNSIKFQDCLAIPFDHRKINLGKIFNQCKKSKNLKEFKKILENNLTSYKVSKNFENIKNTI
jgi:FlaA1/EpsC-like NDP-sugar epimerase